MVTIGMQYKYAKSVSPELSSLTARPSLSALVREFHLISLHCHYLIPVECAYVYVCVLGGGGGGGGGSATCGRW